MEEFFGVVFVLAVGAVTAILRGRAGGGYAPFAIRPLMDSATVEVEGHVVMHQRNLVGTEPRPGRQGGEINIWRNSTTIQKALPEWVAFGWSVDGSRWGEAGPSDRNAVWVDIILGGCPILPTGGILYASEGDLVYDSEISASPPFSSDLVDAARPYLSRKNDLADAVEARVVAGPSPANAIAFRILARQCPDPARARQLAERFRETEDVVLAAAIAAYEFPASRDRCVQIVNRGLNAMAREFAARAIVGTKDAAGLAALLPDRIPAELAVDYLEALQRTKCPEAEPAALYFLDHGVATRTALDVLAAVGARASIEKLLELERRGLDRDGQLGLDITIELVRGRIAAGVGQDNRGGLTLTDDAGEGGAVSLARTSGLAITDDD